MVHITGTADGQLQNCLREGIECFRVMEIKNSEGNTFSLTVLMAQI
jgi:hypothetical protein